MMLFTEVRGLPVLVPARAGRIGTVTSLAVDVASGAVSHVRFRGGRLRGETVLPWEAVRSIGPGALRVESADATPGTGPPCHDLLDRRVLTDAGTDHGTVLDVAFDTETGRLLAVFTTRGEVPANRLLGLGDHALVVRAG
ncbi:PRC-barrel domain-containing protein [Streptomyces sp. ZSW22]|uniref:PRC-barrel domain-containing protein n=1 Tax=Streptomyces sp. ZSW22 TaxID=3055050 RepID=UPI0025B1DCB7|nr:PRC-barrel domain-containing protein [Streptomyces sp. ZSW22]MDN3248360.1 PRC-barrel domain-containing protein [Streptomyces sp. ZSW22]